MRYTVARGVAYKFLYLCISENKMRNFFFGFMALFLPFFFFLTISSLKLSSEKTLLGVCFPHFLTASLLYYYSWYITGHTSLVQSHI